jgi:hypothetical protein
LSTETDIFSQRENECSERVGTLRPLEREASSLAEKREPCKLKLCRFLYALLTEFSILATL